MNVKIQRFNNIFLKEIGIILQTEIRDDSIKFVTLTECDITNDLSFCKVYFTTLNDKNQKDITETLNRKASLIRGMLSKRVDIRHTPELKFIYDESIAYGHKIERRLEELKEKGL